MIGGKSGPDLDGMVGGCRSRDLLFLGKSRSNLLPWGGKSPHKSRQLTNRARLDWGPCFLNWGRRQASRRVGTASPSTSTICRAM